MTIEALGNTNIKLPPLEQQRTLQPHFDEVRHKHAKIAEYKALAQAALQRYVPSHATAAP